MVVVALIKLFKTYGLSYQGVFDFLACHDFASNKNEMR
jgi:hypothetical protein